MGRKGRNFPSGRELSFTKLVTHDAISRTQEDKGEDVNRVVVGVRIRPFLEGEEEAVAKSVLKHRDGVLRLVHPYLSEERLWKGMDYIFNSCPEAEDGGASLCDQERLYAVLGKTILTKTLDGINNCVFTYGTCGSGKTYTLLGTKSDEGLAPRLLRELISSPGAQHSFIEVSVFEILNEKPYDLLSELCSKAANRAELKVREHPSNGPYIPGLTALTISTPGHVDAIIELAKSKSRYAHLIIELTLRVLHTAPPASPELAPSMAPSPPPVPSILPIKGTYHVAKPRALSQVQRQRLTSELCKVKSRRVCQEGNAARDKNCHRKATLTMCDLAGMQQIGKTGRSHYSSDGPLSEVQKASKVNQSLSTLSRVMGLLSTGESKLLPHRDSLLTWLLKDNLSGNCCTHIIVSVTSKSSDYDSILSSLLFAERARKIVSKPIVNILSCRPVSGVPVPSVTGLRKEALQRLKEMIDASDGIMQQREVLRAQLSKLQAVGAKRRLGTEIVSIQCQLQQIDEELSANRSLLAAKLLPSMKPVPFKTGCDPAECLRDDERSNLLAHLGPLRVTKLFKEVAMLPEFSFLSAPVQAKKHQEFAVQPLQRLNPNQPCEPKSHTPDMAPIALDSFVLSIKHEEKQDSENESDAEVGRAGPEREIYKMLENGDNKGNLYDERRKVIAEYGKAAGVGLRALHRVCIGFSCDVEEVVEEGWLERRWGSVGEACRAAGDGDMVVVYPGVHKGRVLVAKNIKVTAAKSRNGEPAVLEHKGPDLVLTLRSTAATVSDLTIRKLSMSGDCAVHIPTGSSCLTRCIIISSSRCGVLSTGGTPLLESCCIKSNKIGVWVKDHARPIVRSCNILRCGDCAVVVEGPSARPLIEANTMTRGRGGGVVISQKGRGKVRNNLITNNECAGVLVEQGGNPTVEGNTISGNKGGGMAVSGKHTRGWFKGNVVGNNSERDLIVSDDARPKVDGNTFQGGAPFGCVFCHGGGGLFMHNKLEGYSAYALLIRNGGKGFLYNNEVTFSPESDGGCLLAGTGPGLVVNNTFWGGEDHALIVDTGRQLLARPTPPVSIKWNSVNKPCAKVFSTSDLVALVKEFT